MSGTNQIYFITGNPNKIEEAKFAIGNDNYAGNMNIILSDLDTFDYQDLITHKIQLIIDEIIKNWPNDKDEIKVITENTSLECENMNGYPGTYLGHYFAKLGSKGLCDFNGGFNAVFVSYSSGIIIRRILTDSMENPVYQNEFQIFNTRIDGRIIDSPRGENGYGFELSFTPNGQIDLTLAEMNLTQKFNFSARVSSIQQAKEYLLSK